MRRGAPRSQTLTIVSPFFVPVKRCVSCHVSCGAWKHRSVYADRRRKLQNGGRTAAGRIFTAVLLPLPLQGDSDMEDYGFEYSGGCDSCSCTRQPRRRQRCAGIASVLLARLHQPASLYRQHAAVCCFAADEELEEQDVDIENQYYNSKGLLESEEWGEALAGFRQVIKMEGGEKGEW